MKHNMFFLMAYLRYLVKSGSRHSVHSPFVYTLVDKVFKNRTERPALREISERRRKLLRKSQMIEITDFGAGSKRKKYEHRFESVASIVRKSAVSEKYGRLLFEIVNFFKPHTIIELGTSVGISASYMAMANPQARLLTVEGCTTKSEQAQQNFEALKISNITQHIGRFDIVLPDLLKQAGEVDFVFIDGNHTYEATMANFNALLKISNNDTIFVLDDIHWSAGMEKAWDEIIVHKKVTVSIDLFRMGIVFLRKELSKQNFVIRF